MAQLQSCNPVKLGLRINEKKTQVMVVGKTDTKLNIWLDGGRLELFTTEREGSDGHRTCHTRMETSYFNLIVTIGLTGEQDE